MRAERRCLGTKVRQGRRYGLNGPCALAGTTSAMDGPAEDGGSRTMTLDVIADDHKHLVYAVHLHPVCSPSHSPR